MDRICQSCGMPLVGDKFLATNADGSHNASYCFYCFKGGKFIDGCSTLEEKKEDCIALATQSGMPKGKAEDLANSILPNLGRWKN